MRAPLTGITPADSNGEPILPSLKPLPEGDGDLEILYDGEGEGEGGSGGDPDAPMDGSRTETSDGAVIIDFDPRPLVPVVPLDHGVNLAAYLPEDVLQRLSSQLLESIEEDEKSREDWMQQIADGLTLMGFRSDEKSYPFDGAAGVYDPMLAEAVYRWQALARNELLPAKGPCKAEIIGEITQDLEDQAMRVATYMNLYCTTLAPEYYREADLMLFWLPLIGSTFKKLYQDPVLKRPVAPFITPQNFIVPFSATDLVTAERLTHVLEEGKRAVKLKQMSGLYRDVDLGEPQELPNTDNPIENAVNDAAGVQKQVGQSDEQYTNFECHTFWDFEGLDPLVKEAGLPAPYIVTINEETQKVLAVYRNWRSTDIYCRRRPVFVHYCFMPGPGFYGAGYAHIMGGLAKTATSSRRQLIDSATLNSFPGGLRVKGMRMDDNYISVGPMEFPEIDTGGLPIQQAIMPMPYKAPSEVTLALLKDTREAGARLAGTAELAIGEGRQDAPVGTTLALLEQQTKLQAATISRAHTALREEFMILHGLFGDHLPDTPYPFWVAGQQSTIMRSDFATAIDVVPVSDPKITSNTQRIIMAESMLRIAQGSPQIHDMRAAYKQLYHAMGYDDSIIEQLLPPIDAGEPLDPLTENQLAIVGAPLAVGAWQDHAAHIQVHMPVAQQSPAMMAHIQEHVAAQMRSQIEMIVGRTLPSGPLPPEVENEVARLTAQATQMLQAQAQGEKPPTPEQLLAMQMQVEEGKTEQRAAESELRARVDMAKAMLDLEGLREKLSSQERVARLNAFREVADNPNAPRKEAAQLVRGIDRFPSRRQPRPGIPRR